MHRILLCLLVLIFEVHAASFLRPLAVYEELAERLAAEDRQALLPFLASRELSRMMEPDYREVLTGMPAVLLTQIHSWRREVQIYLDEKVIADWDKQLFLHFRDELLTMSRATADQTQQVRFRSLALGQIPAILTDIQFRPILAALYSRNVLFPWLMGLSDYHHLLDSQLGPLLRSSEFRSGSVEMMSETMMKAAQSLPESVLSRARRLRDLRWFSISYGPDMAELEKAYGTATELLETLLIQTRQMDLLRESFNPRQMEELASLLIARNRSWLDQQLSQILVSRKLLLPQDRDFIEQFMQSELCLFLFSYGDTDGFRRLLNGGVFLALVQYSGAIQRLLAPDLVQLLDSIEGDLKSLQEARQQKEQENKTRASRKNRCQSAMRAWMSVREQFSLKFREPMMLQDPHHREEALKLLQKSPDPCPDGGQHLTSPHEWIYCTIHGPSPISGRNE